MSNQTAIINGNIGEETTSFDGGKTSHLMNDSSTRIISEFADIQNRRAIKNAPNSFTHTLGGGN